MKDVKRRKVSEEERRANRERGYTLMDRLEALGFKTDTVMFEFDSARAHLPMDILEKLLTKVESKT